MVTNRLVRHASQTNNEFSDMKYIIYNERVYVELEILCNNIKLGSVCLRWTLGLIINKNI